MNAPLINGHLISDSPLKWHSGSYHNNNSNKYPKILLITSPELWPSSLQKSSSITPIVTQIGYHISWPMAFSTQHSNIQIQFNFELVKANCMRTFKSRFSRPLIARAWLQIAWSNIWASCLNRQLIPGKMMSICPHLKAHQSLRASDRWWGRFLFVAHLLN